MTYYQGKKSRRKIGKKKINLYEAVATLQEFKEMYKKNIFPLAVILTKDEEETLNQEYITSEKQEEILNCLSEKYYKTSQVNNETSNVYRYLDSNKLRDDFCRDKIYIDKLIDKDGNSNNVDSMFYSNTSSIFVGLHIVNRKRIAGIQSYIVSPHFLAKEIVNEYLNNQTKDRVLTQEEIDKIHKQGLLTIEEVVKQWETWDLCVPDSPDRCDKFANCHECLLDYARYRQGHKQTNIYKPAVIDYEDTLVLVKKQSRDN